ncbi:MAG: DUF1592 domain-containing protein [Proteobacteria bacterium]|nr:MAG: DUF1592 domain-containing protein [Pseudomonadota bacterium]
MGLKTPLKISDRLNAIRTPVLFVAIGLVCQLLFLNCSQFVTGTLGIASTTARPALRKNCTAPATRGTGNQAARRLTKDEVVNTFYDLFTYIMVEKPKVFDAIASLPDDTFAYQAVNFNPYVQSGFADGIFRTSEALVNELRYNAVRFNIYGSCTNDSTIQKSCFEAFIRNFGRKVWRRPLTTEEQNEFVTAFWNSNGLAPFETSLTVMLASPEFLTLSEERGVAGAKKKLSQYEIAARIAYMTTGSTPDDQLSSAADQQELQTLDQVKSQVTRLISTSRGKDRLTKSVIHYVGAEKIFDPYEQAAYAARLPLGTNRGYALGLGEELKDELKNFIRYVVFEQNGSYHDLMSSPAVFPTTDRVAKIYGTTVYQQGQPPPRAPASERAGLWSRAALLATSDTHTKPFSRGVQYMKRILCRSLPSPDPAVIASRITVINSLSPLQYSNRDIHRLITEPRACMGCHAELNPIGFGLERFNELGQHRTAELVLDANADILATHPIDGSVELNIGGIKTSTSSVDSFFSLLTENDEASACFAETVFAERRYRVSAPADDCLLSEVQGGLSNTKPILSVFVDSIANEDIFWNGSGS